MAARRDRDRARRPARDDTEVDATTSWSDEDDATLPNARSRPALDPTVRPAARLRRGAFDDDRPTEIFQPAVKRSLHASREQRIEGGHAGGLGHPRRAHCRRARRGRILHEERPAARWLRS